MEPTRSPLRLPRSLVAGLLVFCVVASAPPATAQNLNCLNCDFELVLVQWNGSAVPGTIVTGIFEIHNSGESEDSYKVSVSVDNKSWGAESDTETTGTVAPGSGLFAEDSNQTGFKVRMLVPSDAPAGGTATLTVQVDSQNDDSLSESITVKARAKQIYGWNLDCTPLVTAEKSKRATAQVTATNIGNGRDRAALSYTPVEGLVVSDPEPFELGSGREATQNVEIGVGLRAEDGIEDIRWDLRSQGDQNILVQCVTAFEVVGGAPPPGNSTNGEAEESPAVTLPFVVTVLLAALWRHRRHG